MTDQYPRPIIIREGEAPKCLDRIPLQGAESSGAYNERWLQNLLYQYPDALPVAEIDETFGGLIPVCRELTTPAGPIDVVYVTPTGRLAVLEAKLWRNPESRRVVIGQVLDYAKELSRWSYTDLDAQVRAARRREAPEASPPSLFEIVKARIGGIEEANFVDSVARSLKRGDLLLLIAGDGIRENVGAIAEFLEGHGTLHFTFGLIEMSVYRMPDNGLLVQPRVLAQSEIVRRIVVSLQEGGLVASDGPIADGEDGIDERVVSDDTLERRAKFTAFWGELLEKLRLDDEAQPRPKVSRSANLFLYMPTGSNAWVSAYVAQSSGVIGVYLTFGGDLPIGDRLFAELGQDKEQINRELAIPVEWQSAGGQRMVIARKSFPGIILDEHRHDAQAWFADRINRFVTVFRRRLEKLVREDA